MYTHTHTYIYAQIPIYNSPSPEINLILLYTHCFVIFFLFSIYYEHFPLMISFNPDIDSVGENVVIISS